MPAAGVCCVVSLSDRRPIGYTSKRSNCTFGAGEDAGAAKQIAVDDGNAGVVDADTKPKRCENDGFG
jgi:hypothetical protein